MQFEKDVTGTNYHTIKARNVLSDYETGRVVAVFYNEYDIDDVIKFQSDSDKLKMNKENIKSMKKKAKQNIQKYYNEIADYRKEHGNEYTEFLVYRLQMHEYWCGVLNTLKIL